MDAKTKGAWLVHHTHKLEKVTHQGDYFNILTAGKMGVLLSALAETNAIRISKDRVAALASANGINPLERDAVLMRLRDQHLIDVQHEEVQVIGVTSASILQHTATAFDGLGPSGLELASLALAETASERPVTQHDARAKLADEHKLASTAMDDLFRSAETIGFVDAETVENNKIYFNGNLFRREVVQKTARIFDSLAPDEAQRLRRLETELRATGCLELSVATARLGKPLFSKIQSIGFLDVHGVENERGKSLFVTLPAAFGKFFHDDALDLAKSLVACLAYGMTQSSSDRGRITMLPVLLRRLIDGHEVGPATAIGRDYHALEYRGVVSIRTVPGSTRCFMRLMKKDVGELALQVLTGGDASPEALPNLPSAAVNRYVRPESERAAQRSTLRQRAENDPTKTGAKKLLRALRES